MFLFHGAQKILGVLSEFQPPIGSQLWFGGIIELLGGLLVMLGFRTREQLFYVVAQCNSCIIDKEGLAGEA
jgi:putative oxidoreductase